MIAHAPTTPGTPRAPGNRQARLLWTRLAWGVALLFSFLAPAAMASTGPIPEEEDGPLQVWNEKAKYYLIVAVDQRDVPGAKLPFTLTDAALVAKQFDTLGYRPLVQKPIVGPIATRDNLTTTLEQIRELGEWASVVIYYSGHGVASPNDKDVSLQLAGQSSLDYSKGIKVSDLIEAARGDKKYFGELHLIIDACFSGTGAFSGALTLKELGSKTTILTSSSTTQNSIAITLENGTKLSAFTQTLLQALGEEWRTADDNGDGVLRFGEVHTYTSNQLKQWSLDGRLTVNGARVHMHPQLVGGRHEEVILAYDRTKVRRWESSARQALQLAALERNLVPTTSIVTTDGQQEPEIPQEAQRLATRLIPNKDDPYAQGIKAQAEGRLKEAGTLFAQATNLEADHEEKLAKIYLARGRNETFRGNYKEALPWYQKHVALRPTKDPTRLNELGQAWARAGRYEQALPYFTEALAIRENTLEPNDPDLAVSLNNLAALYDSQGQYAEAEPLYQRALPITEPALGTEHPPVATTLNNLSDLYRAQGQYA
ncbi:MAG: tetratricopeptide repeat protein, partial [Nitrospira sp.]|nr:tetratricopeptide repeat protein [Nitrospira sp.]